MQRRRSRDLGARGRRGPDRAGKSPRARFYVEAALVCPHRGRLKIPPGAPFWIGRSLASDLVLPSTAVSRRHAVIEWRDGGYHIHDLLSYNGTRVNGQRVACHRLHSGDEIGIGEFDVRFRQAESHPHPEAGGESSASRVRETSGRAVLRGDLEMIGLDQIIPMLELHGRNGVLEVQGPGGGRIYFARGRVVEARTRSRTGRDAFLDIFEQQGGRFVFHQIAAPPPAAIHESATALILEGMRRRDEGAQPEVGA